MKRIFSLFLAVLCILMTVSCRQDPESTTEETQSDTELSTEERAALDAAALADFMQKYRSGHYQEHLVFQYDDFSAYLQLGTYKGMTYPADSMISEEITDEQVEDYLKGIQIVGTLADSAFTEITDGTVQKFDMVTIDYRGVISGEEHENATASDQELLIGSGTYMEGFESGLIGKEAGKEIQLDLVFSPYYGDPTVAGKPVTFYVTVKKIRRPTVPELTVETINALYGSSFASLSEVKEDIRDYLKTEKSANAASAIISYLELKLMDSCTVIQYPEKEMEHYRNHFVDFYSQNLENGQTLEEYCEEVLGIQYEEFMEGAEDYAKETVKGTLMFLDIAKKENITCTDEQLEALILGLYEGQAAYYNSLEEFLQEYVTIYGADFFELKVISAAVMEMVAENATKVEKTA
ncbi:MAG: FKBP-type peptidyl-prolyl cis-trans isomerase [Clostridia bacterium]|nr:FKBP-type peptidyl-prolyl cis-trans isomerase [Clostridia bacterium]